MVSGWPAYLTRHDDCFSSAVRVSAVLKVMFCWRELVLHVVLGEVGVARHDEAEHQQQRRQGEAADAEEDVERSALHGMTP